MRIQPMKKNFTESKVLLLLALPLIASGLVENSLGFSSTLFLAHLSQEALAAGALVNWVFATLMVIMWGTLSAVSTTVAHYHGAQDHAGVARVFRDGLTLAILASIPAMILIWNLAPVLLLMGQDPKTVILAQGYLHALTWVIFPDFIFTVLLHFVTGLGRSRMNLFFTLLWIPINIFLNYGFVFGQFGFPALGIAGIGWGSAISFWFITVVMFCYMLYSKKFRIYRDHLRHNKQASTLRELSWVGFPMGLMFCIEIGFFTCVTLLMGTISNSAVAANQITLQFLSASTVVVFCLAQATTVRMGHMLGAGDKTIAERVGYLGMFIGLLYVILIALIYWIFPYQLIGLDLNLHVAGNQLAIELAKQFLMICAFFQIFESIRLAMFGALRGLKDTRFTMFISLLTFWGIALPLGYWVGIKLHGGGQGIWWMMVFGQLIAAIILIWRYRVKIREY